MKVRVKTLKGTHFDMEVQPSDAVLDVKRQIEQLQASYPSEQQVLIYQGKVLKNESTLEENKVRENTFLVVMLSKTKSSTAEGSSTVPTPPLNNASASNGGGPLDYLRNNPQFRAFCSMIRRDPGRLQPLLEELNMQNPELLRLIQEHEADFVRLVNEEIGGGISRTIIITPEECEAIERLEAMGFDHAIVVEAFLACDKNEQLTANYLLDH